MMASGLLSLNKYKITRRGRKLQAADDQRTLAALPKDVPERTWAEVLQKEEDDLFFFELREDIVDEALSTVYTRYMEKQNALFTAHCAAQSWLKLIDWHFYRHDPGEEPSAYPPCFIPKREESWRPDALPAPSPKDSWCRQELVVVEDSPDEPQLKSESSTSLDFPQIEEIPSEYWFPGKINVPESMRRRKTTRATAVGDDERGRRRPLVVEAMSGVWESLHGYSTTSASTDDRMAADSEVLQKVTDYSTEEISDKVSGYSALKTTTPVDGSLQGAGDSAVDRLRPRARRLSEKLKSLSRPSMHSRSRSRMLQPLDQESRSKISVISDCRLRNLRLDTHYEVSAEKIDTPPGETVKRK